MFRDPLRRWSAPSTWRRITTLDAHTGGEPLRIIIDGGPALDGPTVLERRRQMRERHDEVRRVLMFEPRGHREMYGCVLMPAVTPEGHFSVLFLHNEGYSTMCGHGVIAVAMAAVRTGLVTATPPRTEVRIDTPAGLVSATVFGERESASQVFFRNVPSFVLALDEEVEVPGIGPVRYDLAFGGAFYAYVDATRFGLRCAPEEYSTLVDLGMRIKHAVSRARPIDHPGDPDLGFLYGTIFIAPPVAAGSHSRNVCVFADGQVDRSPTGTGVSARMAIHYARGEVKLGQSLVIESLVGSRFTGTVLEETRVHGREAVVPGVEGEAFVTGRHEFLVDPADPFATGFFLG